MEANLAYKKMMNSQHVRLTKEGRDFWDGGRGRSLGQWFSIQAHRGDAVDLVGIRHDTMKGMPLKYVRE